MTPRLRVALLVAAAMTALTLPSASASGLRPSGLLGIPRSSAGVVTIPVGHQPSGLVFDGTHVWVSNHADNTVTEINAKTDRVVRTVPVGSHPSGIDITYSDDGSHTYAWVANSGDGSLTEIDVSTGAVTRTLTGIGQNPDHILAGYYYPDLWVSDDSAPSVTEVDPNSGSIVRHIPTASVVSGLGTDGNYIWFAESSLGQVQEFDPSTGNIVKTIAVGSAPEGDMSFDGSNIWVAGSGTGDLTQVSDRSQSVVSTMPLSPGALGAAYDGQAVWVANSTDNTVSEVYPPTRTILRTVSVGIGPDAIVSGPGFCGHHPCWATIWTANGGDNTVSVVPDPSLYRRTSISPPGASQSWSGANPINSRGVIAGTAAFHGGCGSYPDRAFVYFPKTKRYLVLGNPPRLGGSDTVALGIADDNSVAVSAYQCSTSRNFIYLVTPHGTKLRWSKRCACTGYTPVGVNLDGIGLNNDTLGPAVLTFPNGVPQIIPLTTNRGAHNRAVIVAVGTPRGFAGTQETSSSTGFGWPTVWLDRRPYALRFSVPGDLSLPTAMDEHVTPNGVQVDVAGCGCSHTTFGFDYWQGKPAYGGFTFADHPELITSQDLQEIWGTSTDGSMVFGDYNGDPGDGSAIYFPASQFETYDPCGGYGGDSHGDVLGGFTKLCLAQLMLTTPATPTR